MKKITYLFIASLAFITLSCDKDFEEVNTSPNSLGVTDPNLLMASVLYSTQDNVYDMFLGGDMGGVWSQQWSKAQYNDEERYYPRVTAINNFWTLMYAGGTNSSYGGIAEAKTAYTIAGEEGNTNLQAISLVAQANSFQILTDAFGPIPFTEAVVPGNSKPAFDSQEVVYDGILAMLDQAETLFASGTGSFTPTADLVYGGDVTKWRKFAASLKLKVLMRISGKRSVDAEVQDLVASGLLFSSNADSASFAYTVTQPYANPIYVTVVYGTRNEYRLSSVLVDKMNALSDPRLPVYGQLNNGGVYAGNVPGNTSATVANYSAIGTKYLMADLPGVLLSYAQVEFLLAEAANEGIIPGSIAQSKIHYVNGITASFAFNGLAAPSAGYLGSAAVDYTTQADGREKIATQEWLALYGQGFEAWTEWRRTGYPALLPVLNAAIPQVPSRYPYSSNTQSFNGANYAAASATLSNGDSMLSNVWWMN